MVDMVDLFQMRIFQHRYLVETWHHLAHLLEGSIQRAKALHIGFRAHVFVTVQNGDAVLIAHGDYRFVEPTFIPGALGAFLGFHGQRIGLITVKSVLGRDDVRADALRHKVGFHGEIWVNSNCCPIAAHGHATHHFDAARDVSLARATCDLVCREVHGFHARGTETVDREAGNRFIQIGSKNRRPRQAPALFHNLGHVPPDHVLYCVAFKIVTLFHRVQRHRTQAHRGYFMQRAVLAALAARCADGVVNICFSHFTLLRSGPPGNQALVHKGVSSRAVR